MRNVNGIDVWVHKDGDVTARKAPGAGWDSLGTIVRTDKGWVTTIPTLWAWRYVTNEHGVRHLDLVEVQHTQRVIYDKQRSAVKFLVEEAQKAQRLPGGGAA